jgi:hypothetical protein
LFFWSNAQVTAIPPIADCHSLPQHWLQALASHRADHELTEQKVQQLAMDTKIAHADFDRRLRQM